MGARDFTELHAWRLAHELRLSILRLTARGTPAWSDFRFRAQIRDSSSSVASNISEGFGRFRHREFAYFLHIACGSLKETLDHVLDGRSRGYFSKTESEQVITLGKRAYTATARLLKYLEENPDP